MAQMIQITYQPAFDPFHTIYRVFRLRDRFKDVEIQRGRIVDFYLLFPFRLSEITFKRGDQRCKKTATNYSDRRGYAIQPAPRALFESMKPVYDAATQTMAAEGYLDNDALLRGMLTVTTKPLPGKLSARIFLDNEAESDLLHCLYALLDYDLLGADGLKARTGLMEHRNDAA
jgi:hypothetical protein